VRTEGWGNRGAVASGDSLLSGGGARQGRDGVGLRKSGNEWREKSHKHGGLVPTGRGQRERRGNSRQRADRDVRGRSDVSAQWGSIESLTSEARLAAGMGR
jgi:hypothetical protein